MNLAYPLHFVMPSAQSALAVTLSDVTKHFSAANGEITEIVEFTIFQSEISFTI